MKLVEDLIDFEAELDILNLEHAMLVEEANEEEGEGSKDGFFKKAAEFFSKIFKAIGNFIAKAFTAIRTRMVNIQKAYNKHKPEGNTTLNFPGAKELVSGGSRIPNQVADIADSNFKLITSAKDADAVKAASSKFDSVKNIITNVDKNSTASVSSGDLGEFIKGIAQSTKSLDQAKKEVKTAIKEAKGSVNRKDKAATNLNKVKASALNANIKQATGIINQLSSVAVKGIAAMKTRSKQRKKNDK